jgi:hypothetical protein
MSLLLVSASRLVSDERRAEEMKVDTASPALSFGPAAR